jgi:glycosyltransferase involved in cell wall biosynthesis
MAKARYVVCISNSTKGDLLKFAPYISLDKIKVVYNGIEQFWFDKQELQGFVPSFDKLLLQSEVYLLSVGTDTWNKNLKMLLEAFRELIDMKIRLIRVGPISNANTTLIESWNLSDKIVHLTNVSDLELKWLYSRAMALVFPSIHEGFGWPPLEAMAVGCPVIVSNTSSMPEVCGKAAVYINPHDSKSIVDAVKVLLSNHNFRNEIIRLGRLQAANFEWAVSAKKIFHLFKSMKK